MKTKRYWYSGSCRRVCIVEGLGAVASETSIYLVRATDPSAAARRVWRLARKQDTAFINGDGQRARWAVVSIGTIDELGEGRVREAEVHSTMIDLEPPDPSLALDMVFHMDLSQLGRSGVVGW